MIRFEDLIEKVRRNNPDADVELLRRACVFSAYEHKGQVRHSGEPYLVHPLEVADFLADMHLDSVAIAAGLLHDVVEDTLTPIERIEEVFGADVAHVVAGVTKLGAIPFSSSEERQAESFRKMLLAMVDDIRVILVKLADRVHNMRTLGHLPEDRRRRVAQETKDIYAPIANRLGMSKVKNELEELAFRYLEPEAYEALRAKVENRRRATEGLIEDLRQTIATKLADSQVPIVQLDGRIKRLFSIHQKLKRQRISVDQVYDLVALRLITNSVKDCYGALGIIHHTWSPVPGRIKDFIAMPRPNGYQSLHTSVVSERGFAFEVQIRTAEMHRVAEEGIAAHWKYKEGRIGADRDEQYFLWLRQMLEWQQEVRDPQEFMQSLKVDLYPEEVYSFTPRGEVKALPRGATIVDFAYTIHTDVGHQCVGGRVNGKMVPLRTPLTNGDIVEIVTGQGRRPSRDWLSFVVTSRARNKIRHFINGEEKKRATEVGRKLLEREARRYGIRLKAALTEDAVGRLAGDLGSQKIEDVYAAIGYGKVAARQVLGKLAPQSSLAEPPVQEVPSAPRARDARSGEDRITVRGFDDLLVFRARCCNPIRGERIVGYITRGKGVSVHSVGCPNVVNLLYDPERRIDVAWDSQDDPAPYVVRLAIQVEDRRGMLADISTQIAGIDTNIKKVEATTSDDQRGRISVTVEIRDVEHLDQVVKSLKGVTGVLDVERAAR
ncbi:MAG: GTP pyrophosphokinase [Acidobacteria bacterium]|nr:GTP pyrophosphokinase [Acidobacteriota bacterium]